MKKLKHCNLKGLCIICLVAVIVLCIAAICACERIVLEKISVVYNGGDVAVDGYPDKADISVTAHYSDGTSKTVGNFAVLYDFAETGTKTVTVIYTEGKISVRDEFAVKVVNPPVEPDPDPEPTPNPEPPVPTVTLTSVSALYNGADITLGGQLNSDFMVVTAYYSDGTSKQVTNYSVGNFSPTVAGAQKITISYTEKGATKECELDIVVVDPSVTPVADGNLSVHFLELGNASTGDCVYIKAGDTDILIDAGSRKNSAQTIIKYLNQYVTDGKLEYVIATHEHQDHISGFMGLSKSNGIFQEYECETIIDFPRYNSNLITASGNDSLLGEYIKARDAEVEAGANHYTALECVNNENGAQKVYDLTEDGSIKMEILYQRFYEDYASDINDYSVCVMITQGENHYLFAGDLEQKGEQSLVECNPDLPQMVLFKGGHHGSYTATGEMLLRKIRPQYVCICCCAGNIEYTQNLSNTFPAQAMIDRVAPYTDKVYVTTLGPIKYDETKDKYVNDGFTSFNGNIVFSCVDGVIGLECSNNNLKLKDTEWFKKYRICPDAWKQGE